MTGAGLPGLMLALAFVAWGRPAAAQVQLDLRIPAAETHVLGDPIPLMWRFSNQSTQALGFMWEGCCRLNGRLEVLALDRPLPIAPPGQALAHMFARADRLDPGTPKEYDTKVSDWVRLPGTGTYEFRGTYRGVLPTQFPQVQRGLALWRAAAVSAPVELRVLGVDDYLGQREERSLRRKLKVSISGPGALPPLGSATFRVTFENTAAQPRSLQWPDAASLWILDASGERVAPAAVLTGATTTLNVAPGGRTEVEFTLGTDRLEGEPLGDYRLFVDLESPDPAEPRVPSGPIPLAWRLTRQQVASLLREAALGAGTGARNAPLKLLRVHLAELASDIAAIESTGTGTETRELAHRLALAARLRPLHPRPGLAELRITVGEPSPTGIRWTSSVVQSAFLAPAGTDGLPAQLVEILGVRRHLGWEVEVQLDPGAANPTLGALSDFAASVDRHVAELSGPPVVVVPTGGTNAPARLRFNREPGSITGPALRIDAAGRFGSVDGRTWEPLVDDAAVMAKVAVFKVGAGGREVLLVTQPSVGWESFRKGAAAILGAGSRVEVRVETGRSAGR